jgi:hypothetical protein
MGIKERRKVRICKNKTSIDINILREMARVQ